MGQVFAAYDEQLDRRVAIKVLNKASDDSRAKILREAKAMAKLSHPHVVQVFEVGDQDGQDFIAMEYLDGPSLDEWRGELRRINALSLGRALWGTSTTRVDRRRARELVRIAATTDDTPAGSATIAAAEAWLARHAAP